MLTGPSAASPAAQTGKLILDKLCKFIAADTQATFDREGADIFASADSLQAALKRADPAALEKSWIRDEAEQVNMDMEGRKGKILESVTNSAIASEMFHFYNYFKLLYKFCQLGMTLKSKQSLVRKQENAQKEMDDIQVKIDTQQAINDNLDFANSIDRECMRAECDEVQVLERKMINLAAEAEKRELHNNQRASY